MSETYIPPAAPPLVETARLRLRKPRLDDAEPIFDAYAADPAVTRYLTFVAHADHRQTADFLRLCLDEWEARASYAYVIEEKRAPGRPVGMIHPRCRPQTMDFGYVLARPLWGRGLMSEALTRLVDWSLDQPEVYRAAAYCDAEHAASARVMEKAGLSFEGIFRRYAVHPNLSPEPRDCRIYAKVK